MVSNRDGALPMTGGFSRCCYVEHSETVKRALAKLILSPGINCGESGMRCDTRSRN
jgi:hypothetical protein